MSEDLDIRVSCGLWDHPKWMRLDAALGEKGGMSLLRLWGWSRRHRPNGDLSGISDKELAAAARWKGQAARFVSTLAEIGWLDGEENNRRVHGWREHQTYASNTTGFKRAQKIKALERWAAAARMPLDEYVRHTHGMTVEEYLAPEGHSPAMPRHGAGQEPGMVPGNATGNAATMPPPIRTSSPSLPTRSPERAREPDPEQSPAGTGYATTPQSPQVEPTTGRSPRHLDGDPPVPAPTPKRTAMDLAESLRKRTLCGLHEAAIAVESLLADGAPTEWVQQRILRTIGTPKPWDWGKAAKAAWADHMDRVGVES